MPPPGRKLPHYRKITQGMANEIRDFCKDHPGMPVAHVADVFKIRPESASLVMRGLTFTNKRWKTAQARRAKQD